MEVETLTDKRAKVVDKRTKAIPTPPIVHKLSKKSLYYLWTESWLMRSHSNL
jgi:hypothetical protein